ncbi:hypothetical protein BCR35DRAFT_308112 [Leucosporidium creatinivorum]|uniref:C2H2-type domain-containing protein n=1 Tax=Leucosporidium creatinivorum TaxID=106004 RepID=A0A1Y2EDG7_9BASI|nr:hypothetical protein BCR35DRAFT_308112 [Leucosporidium creatinivorum]
MEKGSVTSLHGWAPPFYPHGISHRHQPTAPDLAEERREQRPRGPGDDEEDGRYQRIFKLPNQSLHPTNSRSSFPPHQLPPLPLLNSPSPSASTSALPSPSGHGYAAPNYFYPSGPATYDWPQALPPMRLKPPTPPTVPTLAPPSYTGGWEDRHGVVRSPEEGDQAQFTSSVHALTNLASRGGGGGPSEPTEWSPSNESGSGEGSVGKNGKGNARGKGQERKTYASTDSEEGEIDGIKSKKRKRRRKANEQPRDAAKRRFTCQADGCGKSFARPSALSTHERSHSKEKPHVCPFPTCGRPFAVPSNLRRHQKVYNHFVDALASPSQDPTEGLPALSDYDTTAQDHQAVPVSQGGASGLLLLSHAPALFPANTTSE